MQCLFGMHKPSNAKNSNELPIANGQILQSICLENGLGYKHLNLFEKWCWLDFFLRNLGCGLIVRMMTFNECEANTLFRTQQIQFA